MSQDSCRFLQCLILVIPRLFILSNEKKNYKNTKKKFMNFIVTLMRKTRLHRIAKICLFQFVNAYLFIFPPSILSGNLPYMIHKSIKDSSIDIFGGISSMISHAEIHLRISTHFFKNIVVKTMNIILKYFQ